MTPTDPKNPGGDDRRIERPKGAAARGRAATAATSSAESLRRATAGTRRRRPRRRRRATTCRRRRRRRPVRRRRAAPASWPEADLLHNVDVEHEHADINIRAVIGSAIILFVVVVVSQLVMWGLFVVFEKQATANEPAVSPLAAPPTTMPKNQIGTAVFTPETMAGPQLLTNEPMNLQQQRDKEQKVLHGYGWVNQGAGVARMPIDQAKKLIVERGLPVREGEEVSPTLGTRLPARGESSGGRIITMGAAEAQPEAPCQGAGRRPGQEPAHGGQPAKPHGPGGH